MPHRTRRDWRPAIWLFAIAIAGLPLMFGSRQRAVAADTVFVAEGDMGAADAVFQISLSTPMSKAVEVGYATSGGTAIAGSDYVPTSGTAVFRPGETRKLVAVAVIGDRLAEGDETFYLDTSGSRALGVIVDDDPAVSVAPQSMTEGDSGTHSATFVVTLAIPSILSAPTVPGGPTTTVAGGPPFLSGAPPGGRAAPVAVSVDFSTSDGTATVEDNDYLATTGTLIFQPGEMSKVISVPIVGDLIPERDETFFVNLSNPSRGQITTSQASEFLLNDDAVAFTGEPPAASTQPGGPLPPGGLPSGLFSAAATGEIFAFGESPTYRSSALRLNQPVVGAAATPSRKGYWLVASDGGLFSFGDAPFAGSAGAIKLNQPVVGMASTPTGSGYWLVASDGGIFSFGDAAFHGSTGGIQLNKPIVGMAATPTGDGYWLVASDGGIFSFGDAAFHGSTGDVKLDQPIVGMATTPSGDGYWLVTSHGGVFNFGDARFLGSVGGTALGRPIVGIAATATGNGYWLMGRDGGLFSFGDAPFFPTKKDITTTAPVVGIVGTLR